MERLPTSIRRLAVAALLLLAAACSAGTLLLWRPSATAEASAALQRWRERPTEHYRLQIDEVYRRSYLEARCTQDVEVQGEQVVTVRHNTCPTPPQTVSTLFAQMRDLKPVTCITFGCACDFVGEPSAVYDAQQGYPSRIIIRWSTVPNWRHPDFWRAMWQLRQPPRCTPASTPIDRTLVVELTPLQ